MVDKTYQGEDFSIKPLQKGEYDSCIFENCNFSGSDISEIVFLDCEFNNCDLSLVNLTGTAFREVHFKTCKMLGLRFDSCAEFGLDFCFRNCLLNNSVFYQTSIVGTVFKDSQLIEVDFSDSNLSKVIFENCDLTNATFDNTNLEEADFRNAVNYIIDPNSNQIKKAKFALPAAIGLLRSFNIEITTGS